MSLKRLGLLALACVSFFNLYATHQSDGLQYKVDRTSLKGGGVNMTCKTENVVYSKLMQVNSNFYLAQRQPEGAAYFPLIFSMENKVTTNFDSEQQSAFKGFAQLIKGKGYNGLAKFKLKNGEELSVTCQIFNQTKDYDNNTLRLQFLFVLTTTDATGIAAAHQMFQTLRQSDINEIEIGGVSLNIPKLDYATAQLFDEMGKFLIQSGSDYRVLAKDDEEGKTLAAQQIKQKPDYTAQLKSKFGYAIKMNKDHFTYYLIFDALGGAKLTGVCNDDGEVIVPMIYDASKYPYVRVEDQCIEVQKNGKVVIYSFDGKILLEPKYDEVSWYQFKNYGYCEVKIGDKVGVINKDCVEVIPCEYESVSIWQFRDKEVISVTKDGVEGKFNLKDKTFTPDPAE